MRAQGGIGEGGRGRETKDRHGAFKRLRCRETLRVCMRARARACARACVTLAAVAGAGARCPLVAAVAAVAHPVVDPPRRHPPRRAAAPPAAAPAANGLQRSGQNSEARPGRGLCRWEGGLIVCGCEGSHRVSSESRRVVRVSASRMSLVRDSDGGSHHRSLARVPSQSDVDVGLQTARCGARWRVRMNGQVCCGGRAKDFHRAGSGSAEPLC